jgi:very-short-patch-repair endonuclease
LFERQVTFNDLKDESNLYYDFYLPKYKLFIEYEGLQHYKSIPFFGGENTLLKTRKHDIIKYKYAVNNGYKILKIRFIPPKYLEELLNKKLKEILLLCAA